MSAIDRKDAERLFEEADQLYRDLRYADSLAILDRLNEAFPNKHRILFPRARCLAKLGQFQEALDLCQALVNEHDYDKARPLLRTLSAHQAAPSTVELEPYIESSGFGFKTPPPTDGRAFDSKIDLKSPPPIAISRPEKKRSGRRVKFKPIRLGLLLFIGVAVWQDWIVWWLGLGIVAAYLLARLTIGRILSRLLETPFRMKGAALRGAQTSVHGVRRCVAPPRRASEDDDDEDAPAGPVDWFEIDVTITPAQTQGPFHHWEPGDLGLIPAGTRLKKADHMDAIVSIDSCRLAEPPARDENQLGERDDADELGKVMGPLRVILTVGAPQTMREAHFAYYFETFGDVRLR